MNSDYLTFSQRSGLEKAPPQLELGEVSKELRRFLYYYLDQEIEIGTTYSHNQLVFQQPLKRLLNDFWVICAGNDPDTFDGSPLEWSETIKDLTQHGEIGPLFDAIEYIVRHSNCSAKLRQDIEQAFVDSRAAYRLVDLQIIAIGTAEQGEAFQRGLIEAKAVGALASRSHLISAGKELKAGNWSASVRESIHAVEAMAVLLEPKAKTLGPALTKIEEKGHLHGSLKAAFGQLYGYSSDEEGIRHAKVFNDEALVDEVDALFMIGACSSFVAYLAVRAKS